MKELETLLNSLIKMGWKPWGKDAIKMSKQCPDGETGVIYIHFTGEERGYRHIRQLVSIESGLWQFACENKLVKRSQKQRVLNPTFGPEGADCDWSIQSNDFQYRLIESALVPEEELGQFLIDNIKTE